MFNDLNIKKENIPSTLPIFPLSGALLLPGVELPLNIFEPRYIKMVDDALAEKKLIGLVQPKPSLISKLTTTKPLYNTGCMGKIRAFNETDDGRYLVVLSGVSRFSIGEEVATMRGYRRFKINTDAFTNDFNIKFEREKFKAEIQRGDLLQRVNSYLKKQSSEANLDNLDGLNEVDGGFLVDFLCSYLPFSSEEKQLFLEATNLLERSRLLNKVLGIAEAESKYAINPNTLH